jgi:hypothetical protein
MPTRAARRIDFGRVGCRVIEAGFDRGDLSSDDRLMLPRRVDPRIGPTESATAVFRCAGSGEDHPSAA